MKRDTGELLTLGLLLWVVASALPSPAQAASRAAEAASDAAKAWAREKWRRSLDPSRGRKVLTSEEIKRGDYVDARRAGAVYELAKKFGFADPSMATAIACAESRCNPRAVGDNGTSFGLWQIHVPAHPGYTPEYLLKPEGNARAAFRISKGGTDWKHWSTYKTGAYKRFLNL